MLLGLGAFFACLLVFLESPFDRTIGPLPAEGVGLNPLLRHPCMMIHPPMLYSGYTLFAVPFAFAIGALVDAAAERRLDPHHAALDALRLVLPRRRRSCSARAGRTSELGWGGYWAWDPVENAVAACRG